MIFILVLKAQVSYGYSVLSRGNKKYHNSWESMIYRILKGLFNIRVRISKKVFFKLLGFDETEAYDIKDENLTTYQNKFISRLTNKSIKFRIDSLFRNFNQSPQCGWASRVNNKHVVKSWLKTEWWRKNGEKIRNIPSIGLTGFLWHSFSKERNFKMWSRIINETIEELSDDILGQNKPGISDRLKE